MKEDHCLHAALICLGMLCCSFVMATDKLNHSRPSLHGHHEKGREGQVLQRSKRGWVWNQFFVIEEYTGPDPVLVGRLHSDIDSGDGNIKYILSGEGAGIIFVIDDKSGNIHATKTLDREERAQYTLTAQAVDRNTNRPLEPPSEFIVKVQDINDNPPEFLHENYHANVPERSNVERHDVNTLSLPLNIRRGGSDTNLNFDVPDGIFEFHKVKLSVDSLKQKILKVTEQIKIEQTARDGNVAEYLKLVNSADKQQAGRIKQVFEKKNQKSAHSIAQLQKKLEQYHRKLKEIEQNISSKSTRDASKDSLKEIQHSLKDVHGKVRATSQANESCKTGVLGVSLTPPVFVFNKSREFANLIRNKFGSADNIAHLKSSLDDFRPETTSRAYGGSATIVAKPKYTSDDECSSGTSGSIDSNGNQSFGHGGANALENHGKFPIFLEELREIKEAQSQLSEDIENLKVQFKRDYGFISQTLQEERFRYEHLEDQLNDLTDLHQHETANLKQELASIEEKVAYQAYERSRDVQEALESCQTRVAKLELHQQEQQALQSETVNAKVLLGKCINIVLAFMTVILVCVSTIAKFIAPMMKSRFHIICTFFAVTFLAILCKNWDHIICAIEKIIIPR